MSLKMFITQVLDPQACSDFMLENIQNLLYGSNETITQQIFRLFV